MNNFTLFEVNKQKQKNIIPSLGGNEVKGAMIRST